MTHRREVQKFCRNPRFPLLLCKTREWTKSNIKPVPGRLYKELSTVSTGFSTTAKCHVPQPFSGILPGFFQDGKRSFSPRESWGTGLHNRIISVLLLQAVILAGIIGADAGGQPKYLSRKGTWSTWKLRPRRYSSRPASVGKSKVRR